MLDQNRDLFITCTYKYEHVNNLQICKEYLRQLRRDIEKQKLEIISSCLDDLYNGDGFKIKLSTSKYSGKVICHHSFDELLNIKLVKILIKRYQKDFRSKLRLDLKISQCFLINEIIPKTFNDDEISRDVFRFSCISKSESFPMIGKVGIVYFHKYHKITHTLLQKIVRIFTTGTQSEEEISENIANFISIRLSMPSVCVIIKTLELSRYFKNTESCQCNHVFYKIVGPDYEELKCYVNLMISKAMDID